MTNILKELEYFLKKHNINYEVVGGKITVGGSLYLSGTSITTLPDNLTVGGYLDLRGTSIKRPQKRNKLPDGFSTRIMMYFEMKFNLKGFTRADGIMARIINSKGGLKKIVIVGNKDETWLASDGKGNYAHADTAREAVQELAFKSGNRDISQYRNMPKDTVKTPQEWAIVYRYITGACQTGTKQFMLSKGKLKNSYTLSEIIEQTTGAYGYERFRDVVCN